MIETITSNKEYSTLFEMSIVWCTVLVLYVVSTNEVALGCYVFPKGKWAVSLF